MIQQFASCPNLSRRWAETFQKTPRIRVVFVRQPSSFSPLLSGGVVLLLPQGLTCKLSFLSSTCFFIQLALVFKDLLVLSFCTLAAIVVVIGPPLLLASTSVFGLVMVFFHLFSSSLPEDWVPAETNVTLTSLMSWPNSCTLVRTQDLSLLSHSFMTSSKPAYQRPLQTSCSRNRQVRFNHKSYRDFFLGHCWSFFFPLETPPHSCRGAGAASLLALFVLWPFNFFSILHLYIFFLPPVRSGVVTIHK